MKFDDILVVHLGEFGRYQWQQYLLLCLQAILSSLQVLAPVFTAAEPHFRCAPDTAYNSSSINITGSQASVPGVGSREDACRVRFNSTLMNSSSPEQQPCSSFIYDQSELISTVTTEWNLVCDRSYLSTVSSMVYMAGIMVGSYVSGILSDRFGRRITLLACLLLQGSFGVAAAFAPEIYTYIVFRFVTGGASTGVYLAAYVLGVELVGPSKRLLSGILITSVFSTGYFICSGLAYGLQRWRAIQLTISAPSFILVVIYFCLVKESPRWLLSKGRDSEAYAIISRAFEVNGVPMPAGGIKADDASGEEQPRPQKTSLLQAFKSRTLLLRTFALLSNWMAISMCYYGLSYNTKNLNGNAFVNLMLTGVIEFPAQMAAFACSRLGRKGPHIVGMLLGGTSCACNLFLVYFARDEGYDWAYIMLNMIGKFGVTLGFCIIYFWSSEIYPTVLRNTLIGISSAFARIGSIAAPLIADAGKYADGPVQEILAPAIFSAATLIGGFLAFTLPETLGASLSDTIDDTSSEAKQKEKGPVEDKMSTAGSTVELIERRKD